MGTLREDITYTANNERFRRVVEATYDNVLQVEPTLEGAKTGTLTTRTSDTVGTITGEASHGITTAAIVDMFWLNDDGTYGERHGVTVGTVAGTSIPFSLGSGDNLPIATTAIRIMTRHSEPALVVGNDLVGVLVYMATPGIVTIADSGDVELLHIDLTDETTYSWTLASGITNPLAGDAIAKIFLSQYGTATQSPVVTLLYS